MRYQILGGMGLALLLVACEPSHTRLSECWDRVARYQPDCQFRGDGERSWVKDVRCARGLENGTYEYRDGWWAIYPPADLPIDGSAY